MHNHVADLGALANDVGFGIVNAHALRLRETLLRLNKPTTGHRLLRGGITVGGAPRAALPDVDLRGLGRRRGGRARRPSRWATPRCGTGSPAPRCSAATRPRSSATLGYVARASGLDVDARRDHPFVDLGDHFSVVVETGGDVLARYRVRARELAVSAAVVADLARPARGRTWATGRRRRRRPRAGQRTRPRRGLARHASPTGSSSTRPGVLTRVKVVDPSFFNWPALPVALADTIVPDFPLANKSFNQSYAGNDL